MENIDDQAWDAMLIATQDQLDELEAAHTAFKILQASYHREQSEVYRNLRDELRNKCSD